MDRAEAEQLFRDLEHATGPRWQAIWSRIFKTYAREFLTWLARRGVSNADADEIVQTAFLNAVRSLTALLAASSRHAYLWQTMTHAYIDHMRRNKRQPLVPTPKGVEDEEGNVEEWWESQSIEGKVDATASTVETEDLQDCFRNAAQRFMHTNPRRAAYIDLKVIGGLSNEEIAGSIGRTVQATAEFLSQCRKQFERLLRELCGPQEAETSA